MIDRTFAGKVFELVLWAFITWTMLQWIDWCAQ